MHRNLRRRTCSALLGLTLPLLTQPLLAAPAVKVCGIEGNCALIHDVSDEQLAAVAGKYTVAGEIVGMNLIASSSWQTDNGQRLEAAAGLSVTIPPTGEAQARLTTGASVSDPAAPAAGESLLPGAAVSGGARLASTNGAAQIIQVAGDANTARNATRVMITDQALPAITGNPASSASAVASNGAKAQVAFDENALLMQLALPQTGQVLQHVNAARGRLVQNIQIAGHNQQVSNHLQLQLQMRPQTDAALAAHGFAASLERLKGR